MPKYTVQLTKKAAKQLDKIPDKFAIPLLEDIQKLEENPRPDGYKKLKGREAYRIRKGNYRAIYEIFDSTLIIDVITIAHRKDVYNI